MKTKKIIIMRIKDKIRSYAIAMVLGIAVLGTSGCSSVPISGRSRFNMVPDDQVLQMSFAQYKDFISKAPKSTNRRQVQRVVNIGSRIARATDSYLRGSGMAADADKYRWEFNLIASDKVNAFCMPGGKIVVYEGILGVARTDDELASVVAHEVAHAMAKHSNERMSQKIVSSYGISALAAIIGGGYTTQQLTQLALGMGSKYLFELPYSRQHEYEADKIGLYLMALAGYDYTQAENFWANMASKTGKGTQDFTSTHPTNQKRINAIHAEIPNVRAFMQNGGHVNAKSNKLNQEDKRDKKTSTAHPGIITHY